MNQDALKLVRRPPVIRLYGDHELIIDSFAGGGGASTGIELATGRSPDIGMRMLQPRELYRAQGFPESYCIDVGADGRALSKAAQVRMCGNSVPPPFSRALVSANYREQQHRRTA